MGSTASSDTDLESLNQALRADALGVVFQPIVDLFTGTPIGYEALGRVRNPATRALLATDPGKLLEAAHRHDRLLELDRGWRATAVDAIAASARREGCAYFLNVDPRIIDDPRFHRGFTHALLDRHGLAPAQIVFELTESGTPRDHGYLEHLVRHYQGQGFRIALDDVGAGHASLTALVRLRPEFIKLDKELIRGISNDPMRQDLVHCLMTFARRSGLRVIAEGIEHVGQLETLRDLGVPMGQGFLLGRPAPRMEGVAPSARALFENQFWE